MGRPFISFLQKILTPSAVEFLFPGLSYDDVMRVLDRNGAGNSYAEDRSIVNPYIHQKRETESDVILFSRKSDLSVPVKGIVEKAIEETFREMSAPEMPVPEILSEEERQNIEENRWAYEEACRILQQLHELESKYGISIEKLDLMFRFNRKVSPISIRPIYRIYFDRYNKFLNIVGLQQATYIFFLKHPEGIFLKDLPDYKDELLGIYERISNGAVEAGSAIENLCNNMETNSMNVTISRINRAVGAAVEPQLADSYKIKGERVPGESAKRYRIALPREYVNWE